MIEEEEEERLRGREIEMAPLNSNSGVLHQNSAPQVAQGENLR